MKKSERLELIKKIVAENAVETQHDLLKLLEAEGLTLTQATVSRDMNEIGIIKVPSPEGPYIYGLSKDKTKKVSTQRCKLIWKHGKSILTIYFVAT